MDRFWRNKAQNDRRSILHVPSDTSHVRKCFVFVIICYYPREPRVQRPLGPYLLVRYEDTVLFLSTFTTS